MNGRKTQWKSLFSTQIRLFFFPISRTSPWHKASFVTKRMRIYLFFVWFDTNPLMFLLTWISKVANKKKSGTTFHLMWTVAKKDQKNCVCIDLLRFVSFFSLLSYSCRHRLKRDWTVRIGFHFSGSCEIFFSPAPLLLLSFIGYILLYKFRQIYKYRMSGFGLYSVNVFGVRMYLGLRAWTTGWWCVMGNSGSGVNIFCVSMDILCEICARMIWCMG